MPPLEPRHRCPATVPMPGSDADWLTCQFGEGHVGEHVAHDEVMGRRIRLEWEDSEDGFGSRNGTTPPKPSLPEVLAMPTLWPTPIDLFERREAKRLKSLRLGKVLRFPALNNLNMHKENN